MLVIWGGGWVEALLRGGHVCCHQYLKQPKAALYYLSDAAAAEFKDLVTARSANKSNKQQ